MLLANGVYGSTSHNSEHVMSILLSLDELRALPEVSDGRGVYFLWLGDALQYIGRTLRLKRRMYEHRIPSAAGNIQRGYVIDFDRATHIYMDGDCRKEIEQKLIALEAQYLHRYTPPCNVVVDRFSRPTFAAYGYGPEEVAPCPRSQELPSWRCHQPDEPVERIGKSRLPSVRTMIEYGILRAAAKKAGA